MRGTTVIDGQYHAARAVLADLVDDFHDNGWTQGVADALAWVRGYCEVSPASVDQSRAWPSVDEIVAEYVIARSQNRDGPGEGAGPSWICGVEQALFWAAGGGEDMPIKTFRW